MGRPGIALTAVRWWVEAQGLPPSIRQFRRRAIALTIRSGGFEAIRFTLPTGQLKVFLALLEGRRRIVEIGTGWGWTAATLVLDDPGRTVETYDPVVAPRRGAYLELLAPEARRRIELIQARGQDAEPSHHPVDALFIDDAHDPAEIVATVATWRPALAEGAIVVFDDFGEDYYPGVRAAVSELGVAGNPHGRFFVAQV